MRRDVMLIEIMASRKSHILFLFFIKAVCSIMWSKCLGQYLTKQTRLRREKSPPVRKSVLGSEPPNPIFCHSGVQYQPTGLLDFSIARLNRTCRVDQCSALFISQLCENCLQMSLYRDSSIWLRLQSCYTKQFKFIFSNHPFWFSWNSGCMREILFLCFFYQSSSFLGFELTSKDSSYRSLIISTEGQLISRLHSVSSSSGQMNQ